MKSYSNEKPLFFLFTCVKDGRKYINKLFDSLLSQTRINFVHYIYEDGSNDPIEDLVLSYKEKVSKLEHPYKVIYEKNPVNIGLNMATKHCIDMCSCPYFIWIDCDNWVDKNFFLELEKTVAKNKKAFLIRTHKEIYKNGIAIPYDSSITRKKNSKLQLNELLRSKFTYSFFAVNNNLYRKNNPCNFMINSKVFFNDDQVLLVCLLSKKCKIAYSRKSIGYFLRRDDSVSAISIPVELGRDDQIALLNKIDKIKGAYIESYYQIKDKIRYINSNQFTDPKKCLQQYIEIKEIAKKQHIKLSMFNCRSIHFKGIRLRLLLLGIGNKK